MTYEQMTAQELYAERQALIAESLRLQDHIRNLKAHARELEEDIAWAQLIARAERAQPRRAAA